MKKLILLNIFWALVAVGAYFSGNKENQGSVGLNPGEGSANRYSDGVSSFAGSSHSSKSPGSKGIARKNQNDQLGTGTILSSEVSRRISSALADPDPIRRNANVSQMLLELDQSNVPTDIQLLINNSEIAMVLLRIVEIIGEDELKELGSDTLYFIISALNQLNVDPIRNNILLKVLPLKV